MTDRDRLIELIKDVEENPEKTCPHFLEADCFDCPYDKDEDCDREARKADYLLANGVIVPPCKVGDYVLWDNGFKGSKRVMKEVKGFYYDSSGLGLRYILEDCTPTVNFCAIVGILTKEEAEAELQERKKENG